MRLQFYKKGLPTNVIKRIILLLVVFVAALIFFEILTNRQQEIDGTNMDSPSLPLVSIEYKGDTTTTLHGYVQEMDPCYMRESIIPLSDDRMINLSMDTQGQEITGLSYQIRSLDTERNISGNDVTYSQDGDIITASIQAENLIEKNEEYLLILTAQLGEKSVYYYTRIMETEGCYEDEIIDFAQQFHDKALRKEGDGLATYVESKSGSDKNELGHVTINSSLSQITYGSFAGSQVATPLISLTDISTNYISLTFSYELSSTSGKNTEYYLCKEDFRIRYTDQRIYLLSYDRSMEQILDANQVDISENVLDLGITEEDVDYLSNETGTVVSFTHSGSLFQYNQTERTLKTIYSFVNDPTDTRCTYDQHKIIILNIDESGTMDYVVYGYMNAGQHEGQCGINLYHYDSISNISTEQVFIPSGSSYQILNANFSDLIYESSDNSFYIMVNGTLLYMKLNQLTTEELMTGMDDSQYAVSDSGRYMAWMENAVTSESIHILDLETNNSFDINAASGQLLKPLGFMDDDLIYGIVNKNDISLDEAGTEVYPMSQVIIADITNSTGAKELMSYKKSGIYISDIRIESYTIYLDRIQKDENGNYVETTGDTIKNSAGEQNKAVELTSSVDSSRGNVLSITMAELKEGESLGKIISDAPKLAMANHTRDIAVSTSTNSTEYFVYVGSSVTLATDDLLTAITEADANMGLVVDNTPRYVWKRGRKSYQNAISVTYGSSDSESNSQAKALSAMLVHEGENVQVHTLLEGGQTPISILSSTLKDYHILDLTGATLDQVLYYVSLGNPVYAYSGEDSALLIVGYDAANIIVYNPDNMSTSKMGMQDATDYFAGLGNVFVSYIK